MIHPIIIAGLLFAVCGLGPAAWAQVTVESTDSPGDTTGVHPAAVRSGAIAPIAISTDTVDIFARPQGKPRSTNLALAASLLLPGLGQEYLGRNRAALAYFTADAAAIFGYFFCSTFSQKIAIDAAGYAGLHAQVYGTISGPDDYFWNQVGSFMSVDEYNTAMDLNLTPNLKIYSQSQAWHWDDPSSQNKFNSLLTASRNFQTVGSFFLGALVLNRVIAFIDIRATTRHQQIQTSDAPIQVQPMVSLTPRSVNFALVGSFR